MKINRDPHVQATIRDFRNGRFQRAEIEAAKGTHSSVGAQYEWGK